MNDGFDSIQIFQTLTSQATFIPIAEAKEDYEFFFDRVIASLDSTAGSEFVLLCVNDTTAGYKGRFGYNATGLPTVDMKNLGRKAGVFKSIGVAVENGTDESEILVYWGQRKVSGPRNNLG